ncbi:MAG: dephospho-CoA kinase [Paracoccaceae bacterium]|jgi:dephospho-CoA kinase
MINQIKIALTGSIGMGKSTALKLFKDEGVFVWSADEVVHKLYSKGGLAVAEVAKLIPSCVVDGLISRDRLKNKIKKNKSILTLLENIINPHLASDRLNFIRNNSDKKVLVFDLPLLFENNLENSFDIILVVSTGKEEQDKRLRARGTMDEEFLQIIKSRQIPDKEKRKLGHYVFETTTLEKTKQDVKNLLKEIGYFDA